MDIQELLKLLSDNGLSVLLIFLTNQRLTEFIGVVRDGLGVLNRIAESIEKRG